MSLKALAGVDNNSQRLIHVATPTASDDAANKAYVDAATGAGIYTMTCAEAVAAGDVVNPGPGGLRRANATDPALRARGYVLAGFGISTTATVFTSGINTAVSGLAQGQDVFLSTSPGQVASVGPSASGSIVQCVGVAISATAYEFIPGDTVQLA